MARPALGVSLLGSVGEEALLTEELAPRLVPALHLRLKLRGIDKTLSIGQDPLEKRVISKGFVTYDLSGAFPFSSPAQELPTYPFACRLERPVSRAPATRSSRVPNAS